MAGYIARTDTLMNTIHHLIQNPTSASDPLIV